MTCDQRPENLPECYNAVTKADPDIAGVGVISAFIVAAGLAVVISYIYVLINEIPHIRERVDSKRWSKVLERFILSLSDQQLVTGLAVLIAGFARWNEISIYHWEIITDLAFTSSNTHIATLVVLRRHFRERKNWWPRMLRVTFMVILAILLFVANVYTGYIQWNNYTAWPMSCVALALHCNRHRGFGGEPLRLMIVWSIYLIYDYPIAILGLFEGPVRWSRKTLRLNSSVSDFRRPSHKGTW